MAQIYFAKIRLIVFLLTLDSNLVFHFISFRTDSRRQVNRGDELLLSHNACKLTRGEGVKMPFVLLAIKKSVRLISVVIN